MKTKKQKIKQILHLLLISLFAFFLINIFIYETSYARPGGGHSYEKKTKSKSSKSSSSSSKNNSSYSDSNEERNETYESEGLGDSPWYVQLFSIVATFAVLAAFSLVWSFFEKLKKRHDAISSPTFQNLLKKLNTNQQALSKFKEIDPNFSEVLFIDFASSVFTKYHSWQGKKEFKNLTPYLSLDLIQKYKKNIVAERKVEELVIGSCSIVNFYPTSNSIVVEFDANYTLVTKDKRTRYGITERWKFKRNLGVLSHEPEKMQELSCPQCGVSVGFSESGNCESCGTFIKNGLMQWYVESRYDTDYQVFEKRSLSYYANEKDTYTPTLFNPNNEQYLQKFADNHNVELKKWLSKFESEVVREYFIKIYDAWTAKNLGNIRHLLTDRLFYSYMFWIEMYNNAGLTNKLDKISINDVKLTKIDTDKFYESITVRIFADCKDYVINEDGLVYGGSAKKSRKFSEYWTFIRRTGIEKDIYDYGTCPNCGAPADKMGQTGICEYCSTKISNGDFSWVLAIVTQDEVYKG